MADTNEFKPRPCHHCGAAHGHFTDCLHKYERAIATAPDLGGLWALCNYFSRMKATPPADAALADEWNIEDLLATAVMYMRDVGMPNEADAITELQRRNAALRARAVPGVPLSALVCVGRARFPRTGGNAGIAWHVEDALSDTGGFRSGSPCNGELLFVLPTTAKRAMLAASKSGGEG